MTPYWILFIVAAVGALTERARKPVPSGIRPKGENLNPQDLNASWWLITLGLSLFIGLRHEVGGDWGNYVANLESIDPNSLSPNGEGLGWLATRETVYRLFEWLGKKSGGDIYLVNLLCATLFAYGLARFCRSLPRPWLALAAAIPYLVIVVAMGYTRQGVAIGCAMAGFTALTHGQHLRFLFWVILAAGFHLTALVLLPLALLVTSRRWFVSLIAMVVIAFVAAVLALGDTLAPYTKGYIEVAYQSEGALVRLSMNLLPALLFLMTKKRMAMAKEELRLFRWLSLGAVVLTVMYLISPSSTAVDRIGLYLIPLQLAVFSHLPNVLKRKVSPTFVAFSSVLYFGLVLFVWLAFAVHSGGWLPYQTLIWLTDAR